MKSSLNTKLFDSLIESDFLILNSKTAYNQYIFQLDKNCKFYNLNPIQTLKNLKQFTRLIQFIKKMPKGTVSLNLNNKQYISILSKFLNKYPMDTKIFLQPFSTKKSGSKDQNLLILLNELKYKERKLTKKLISEKRFLVQKINKNFEKNSVNSYKIFNDLMDLKKFIFFICLIRQICLNSK